MLKISFILALGITSYVHSNPFANLHFHGTQETLENIRNIISQKQKGAYLRFGDGDVLLANNTSELLQSTNPQLAHEMREAFALQRPTILKTLPLYCKELGGFEEGMFPGNHEAPYEWCLNMLHKAQPLWGSAITDVYSHAALHFAATEYPNEAIAFLKFLKKSNCCILVGNEQIPSTIKDLLFGPQCVFIPTPVQQSFKDIDRIEKECLQAVAHNNDYKIIVTAMGCSGRVLQKRLWHKLDNVFLFDFGSLMDALCGWNTRAWMEVTHFNAQKFIENLTKEVKIVYTAALIDKDFETRKQEYLHCLKTLQTYNYITPYVIEAIGDHQPSFFEDYTPFVYYSQVNNPKLRNKGVNEGRSLLAGFNHFNFNPHDMIVKITGRYYFNSPQFLQLIENNPSIDVFVKLDTTGQVFTGCFAMKYSYFKDMLETLDYAAMEKNMINIEQEVATYIKKIVREQKAHIMYVDNLNVTATIYGDGTTPVKQCW